MSRLLIPVIMNLVDSLYGAQVHIQLWAYQELLLIWVSGLELRAGICLLLVSCCNNNMRTMLRNKQ